MPRVRLGCQEPTFEHVSEYDHTYGPEAVELFEAYGVEFMPYQKRQMDLFQAKNADGTRAALSVGFSIPRQNGKSFAARFYALYCAAVLDMKVLYTAHHGGTSRKMFRALRDFVAKHNDFKQTVALRGIHNGRGEEGIDFRGGGCIEFNTRTVSGPRGGTFDAVIVDEAQELTDEQMDALKPVLIASESGEPQTVYIGTPPNEKCPGTVFKALSKAVHSGTDATVWWQEWAVDEVTDPQDKEAWYRCCPAMGYLITERAMQDAADSYVGNWDGFSREYLGWWSKKVEKKAEPILPKGAWESCLTDSPAMDGTVSFGVKFSPSGGTVAVAACCRPAEGTPHVELIEYEQTGNGVRWLAEWLKQRKAKAAQITIDGKAWGPTLITMLTEDGKDRGRVKQVVEPGPQGLITACSMLLDAVVNGDVTHIAEPRLDEPMERAVRRPVGKAGGWGFDVPDGDAAPVEAVALAFWGAMTTKRRPNRRPICG